MAASIAAEICCLSSCEPTADSQSTPYTLVTSKPQLSVTHEISEGANLPSSDTLQTPEKSTPLPTRERWDYGSIVPYTVQSGDTVKAIAAHFDLEPEEILAANPGLTGYYTTLPPGIHLQVPASFTPHLGTPFRIIPDSEFVYGPAQAGLDIQAIILIHTGWLATRTDKDQDPQYQKWDTREPSWKIVQQVALNYSINPLVLLALLEFRSGILTDSEPDVSVARDPLALQNTSTNGIKNQLSWAAEMLNTGYYGWRSGELTGIKLSDGRVSRIDPWQNAATAALHYLFGLLYVSEEFQHATSPEGFSALYQRLFGDPFSIEKVLIPANLQQPNLVLPFQDGVIWSFTGGPHAAWGGSVPWAALDFAPPSAAGECGKSNAWATAVADGIVARSRDASVVLDLDGDGNEHTGWTVLYFHLRSDSIPTVGKVLQAGDPIGHPSCEGGRTTGTHVHIARRYNGEWIDASGEIPFTMSGWVAHSDGKPYKGRLTQEIPAKEIVACECVSQRNLIYR